MFTVATVFANVLIYGMLGWAVVGWLGYRGHARVAGLFLAMGFAIGSFGGHATVDPENLLRLRGLGSLLGLGVLATSMFYRHRRVAS